MHRACEKFLNACAAIIRPTDSILEIGSRNVNGTARSIFAPLLGPTGKYMGIDIRPGSGVDKVADGQTFQWHEVFDVVVCTETLEHATDPRALCRNMLKHARVGGCLIVTAAGLGRAPHSGVDGNLLRAGEIYGNISAANLRSWLSDATTVLVDDATSVGDICAMVLK